MTPSDIARQYASDVVSGGIVACRYVKLACQRFLNDLERQDDDDWTYVFDEAKADRAVKFMQLMPHTKGKWSASKSKLVFEPWQVFIEANIFGWVKKDTGKRRFREAYEEIPRKNGKSARLAARGIYLFAADGESGAEVYSGATTEKQAFEVFRPAWMMAHKLENLRNRFGIELSGNQKNPGPMFVMEDMSKFETVIGNPGDGASPHAALVDEYHEHDTDALVDTMQTGMGAREQPLLSIITTSGSNLGGPCYEKRRDVIRILEGQTIDETIFGIIYTIDEDDSWDDPASLIKANPNYGVSVFPDFLLAQLQQAKRSASKQNAFRTKHLNQWVGARTDAENRYIIGSPQNGTTPTLWRLPVVETQAITQDEFLTGAFSLGAQIFDRMDIEVLVSTENDKDFENNMVTIRAEERLAFAVYRPEAFVTGSLTAS
ncbi:UNVERIFIED_CONTAM: Putative terminase large subunit [Trichonephila clavipes]